MTQAVENNVVHLRESRYEVFTAEDLINTEFPPINWAIPDILPAGVTLFGGREKMGKSWFALGECIAIANGGYVLGKIPVEQGTALFISLEDSKRRLRDRVIKLKREGKVSNKLVFATDWPRVGDGAIEYLAEFLDDYRDTRLVVIDTLKRIRPYSSGRRNIYDVDYEAVAPFVDLVADRNVALKLIHHLNQEPNPHDPYDSFQGSSGLTGAVEGIMILRRTRGDTDAELLVEGKDVERQDLAIKWAADACTWTVEGDAEHFRMSKERREIIDVYKTNSVRTLTPTLVASQLKKDYDNVRQLMYKMDKDNQLVSNNDGSYSITR
jgi:AAA domain